MLNYVITAIVAYIAGVASTSTNEEDSRSCARFLFLVLLVLVGIKLAGLFA